MNTQFISQFNEHLLIKKIILSKTIKLRKFIMEAMDLEICMRKYRGEAHVGGYVATPLHAMNGSQRW